MLIVLVVVLGVYSAVLTGLYLSEGKKFKKW